MSSLLHAISRIYHFPLDEAAVIAIRTAKQFVAEHSDELDVIKWVLFDDVTLGVYERELAQWGKGFDYSINIRKDCKYQKV